jgi:hypothetical protein
VEYLVENAEKDSQIVYIDSSLRNKLYYPNANEYTVEFDQPFKLVYGFDVLDATIPVTMYNIDIYNQTISFTVVQKNPASLQAIDPEQYMREISKSKTFAEAFNREVETYVVVGEETELSSYLPGIMTTNDNYIMYYRKSLLTTEIQKRTLQSASEFYIFKYDFVDYCIKDIAANQVIIDILKSEDFSINVNTNDVELIYFEKHVINSTAFLAIKSANSYIVLINNYRKTLEAGNYDILTLINDLNDLMNPSLIDVETTTAVPKKQAKLQFLSSHYILMNAAQGEMIKSLGFDTYPGTTASSNYKGWTIGTNYMVFGAVRRIESGEKYPLLR